MKQREIKFRAWDTQDKRMITHEQEFIPLKVTSIGVLRLSGGNEEDLYSLVNPDRFELMQFTGLLDKNGVEIYEGDVLKVDMSNGMIENYEVFFNQEDASFDCRNLENTNFIIPSIWDSCEVILNIHQNPELCNQ